MIELLGSIREARSRVDKALAERRWLGQLRESLGELERKVVSIQEAEMKLKGLDEMVAAREVKIAELQKTLDDLAERIEAKILRLRDITEGVKGV